VLVIEAQLGELKHHARCFSVISVSHDCLLSLCSNTLVGLLIVCAVPLVQNRSFRLL
jgi:hypothetical protein